LELEVTTMLMRTDPLRELDRLTRREGDEFVVEFDLPGIKESSLNIDVDRIEAPSFDGVVRPHTDDKAGHQKAVNA
jgi:hypothetical protein